MPSSTLTSTLVGLGGQGGTLLRGTITAVSTGLLTIRVNGDVFTRVSYLKGSWSPAVGEEVFLVSQENFGTICLGAIVAAPAYPVTTQAVTSVDPSTVANWQLSPAFPAGRWVDLTGVLQQVPDRVSSAVWFYPAASLGVVSSALASVQMQLQLTSGGPVELMLHTSTGPSGVFTPLESAGSRVVNLTAGTPVQVALPLDWGKRLIAGTARGITARSASRSAELFAHGTLTFTAL